MPAAATTLAAPGPGELIPASVVRGPNLAVMIGGAMVLAGSLLPWITTSAWGAGLSFSGVDGGGDGWVTLTVGVGIIGLVFAGRGVASDFNRVAVWLLALIAAAVFWVDLERVRRAVAGFELQAGTQASAGVGIGLWLIALGAVVAFALNIARPAAVGPGTLPSIFARGG